MFPGARVLDCTLGGGGHSEAILQRVGESGVVTGLDVDERALSAARARLSAFSNFRSFRVNFGEIGDPEWQTILGPQDAVLMDLGVSSPQLDVGERGFSIRHDGPLDMRMDSRLERTAADVVADSSEAELRQIFREYGEESQAGRVARLLVQERLHEPVLTTGRLVDLVSRVLGRPRPGKVHPATKIFQALRMEVNSELERLQRGLEAVYRLLKVGGRLCVLSYHSLEDRTVKKFIEERSGRCRCPRGVPVCVCGARATLRRVGSKAIQASLAEVERNPRARSVRMRVAERVAGEE